MSCSEKETASDAHARDCANAIRRSERNPLRVPAARKRTSRAVALHAALPRRDGPLGSAITDGFAMDRPVILFNNAGVASSSGETPNTVDAMGDYAADFVGALGLSHVDVLGFSIGGYIAQALTLRHPALVKRLMLVGTGPRAGEPPTDPKYSQYGTSTDPGTGETGLEAFLYLFFSPSTSSQAAGRAFWERRHLRRKDIDPPSSAQAMKAQLAAIAEWREVRGERFGELKRIAQPTLAMNGNRDIMVPTINSLTLSQHIPNAH